MVNGKTTNGLMRHLRDNHNLEINGSRNKKDLLNMGYYHGYKGYRFIGNSESKIPFEKFDEVVSVYEFDIGLKAILYPKLMFIETAVKNYTLETIIKKHPVDFEYIFSNLLNDYKKEGTGNKKYKEKMKRRLQLRDTINSDITYNYNRKALVQHFFHKNEPIPLWAIFEVISMGTYGVFLQCLNLDTRIDIAKEIGIHSTSHNQNGRILEDIIFLIKDLRNSVAHNSVVFDCRFKNSNPSAKVKEYLHKEFNCSDITFRNIVDYFFLVILLMKKLGVSKTEMKKITRELLNETEKLRDGISVNIHASIMGSDFRAKINKINDYI